MAEPCAGRRSGWLTGLLYLAAVNAEEIQRRLQAAFADAEVVVVDEAGDGNHFAATLVSPAFAGKRPLERHRLVYAALGEAMHTEIHALRLCTLAPGEPR